MNPSLLEQIPLFASLPSAEVQHLATVLRLIEVPAGTILFREGEIGEHFYILLEGEVEIIKAFGSADERLLSMRGPGAFFGEMSLLNPDAPRTATVRARSAVQLLEMAHKERIKGVLCASDELAAQGIADRLLQSVMAHTGAAPREDDVTVVVIRAQAAPGAQRVKAR